jgi:hypothetical protein
VASQKQAGKILSQIKQSPDVQIAVSSPTYRNCKGTFSSSDRASGERGLKLRKRLKKLGEGIGMNDCEGKRITDRDLKEGLDAGKKRREVEKPIH